MANIGATTAFYKGTALTKANMEVSRVWSVWRGKARMQVTDHLMAMGRYLIILRAPHRCYSCSGIPETGMRLMLHEFTVQTSRTCCPGCE